MTHVSYSRGGFHHSRWYWGPLATAAIAKYSAMAFLLGGTLRVGPEVPVREWLRRRSPR